MLKLEAVGRTKEKKSGSSEHVLCKQAMKRKTFTIKKAVTGGADSIPLNIEGNVLLTAPGIEAAGGFSRKGELHGMMRNGLSLSFNGLYLR